ncbi:sensor histidine kinase [Lentzea sp. NPDC051213]|uniref:sensor histidine kinase n=1 Tax=Lentzea sp. NPDC051213 TaxID=3364126 RepID=UPI00379A227D
MSSEDAWDRTKVAWHVAFAVFAAVGVILVVAEDQVPRNARFAALALLAALCLWYWRVGAPLQRDARGVRYLAVAIPLVIAMFALVPALSVLFFALYPHIWSLLEPRLAIWATALTSASIGIVVLVTGSFGPDSVGAAVIIFLSVVPAVMLGLWIARIIQQSRERAELADVSHEAGVLTERERLARDLHDTLAQGATSVLLLLRAARTATDPVARDQHLALAEQTTAENLAEIRALVAALTPAALNGSSLPAALERLTSRLGRELGLAASMNVTGEHRPLPPDREVMLLRVTQEALANVRKHAHASTVTVSLDYSDAISLRIADDGRGFGEDAPQGYGLDGLRDRVRAAGGVFDIRSAPGEGVHVHVRLEDS